MKKMFSLFLAMVMAFLSSTVCYAADIFNASEDEAGITGAVGYIGSKYIEDKDMVNINP